MDGSELCRLCAQGKNRLIPIYDDEGSKLQIANKIKKLLSIELEKATNLPKSICLECCDKLESFNEFLEISIDAQITLSIIFPLEKEKEVETLTALQEFKSVENPSAAEMKLFHDSNFHKDQENVSNCFDNLQLTEEFITKADMTQKVRDEITNSDKFVSDRKLGCTTGSTKIEKRKQNGQKQKEWESDAWLCSECSEVSSSVEELTLHHNNEHNQDVRFMCTICSKMFLAYSGFTTHMKRHMIPSCEYCGKDFSDKKTLERHKNIHSSTKPYICSECGKRFRLQSALIVHSKCHLPDDAKNKFPCSLCDKKFSSKPNMVTHMRIHTGVRDFTCDQCGKGFIQKGNLDAHLLTHSMDKPFACSNCDKSFKTELQLKKHQSVHADSKPFQCHVCGRTFREKRTLRDHHRIHTGALPFTCEYCGKSFRFKGILTTHRRLHTGERPYSCAQCQHYFTNWPNYNKHMKRRHGINTSSAARAAKSASPAKEQVDDNPLVMYSDQLDTQELFLGSQALAPPQAQLQYTTPTIPFVYTVETMPGLDIIPR